MTDRRSHWDDYLLASVMIHCNDIEQCYAVIAAVEDWQIARMKGYLGQEPVGILTDLGNAEAAIARVRELHRQDGAGDIPWCFECDVRWPCPTIKALDGAT